MLEARLSAPFLSILASLALGCCLEPTLLVSWTTKPLAIVYRSGQNLVRRASRSSLFEKPLLGGTVTPHPFAEVSILDARKSSDFIRKDALGFHTISETLALPLVAVDSKREPLSDRVKWTMVSFSRLMVSIKHRAALDLTLRTSCLGIWQHYPTQLLSEHHPTQLPSELHPIARVSGDLLHFRTRFPQILLKASPYFLR